MKVLTQGINPKNPGEKRMLVQSLIRLDDDIFADVKDIEGEGSSRSEGARHICGFKYIT